MSDLITSPLARAKLLAGGNAKLAEALTLRDPSRGLTPQAVSQWRKVPADRVLDVEALTGISRHELRPDVFGSENNAESAA